jgi:hypothetical protein
VSSHGLEVLGVSLAEAMLEAKDFLTSAKCEACGVWDGQMNASEGSHDEA